jgi:hypothetical protein
MRADIVAPPLPFCEGVEFREIPGWPGYAASDDGRIWSCKGGAWGWHNDRWTELCYAVNNCYRVAQLFDGEKTKKIAIGRLVLLTFVGESPPGRVARHLNGDPEDDRLDNLAWLCRKDFQPATP